MLLNIVPLRRSSAQNVQTGHQGNLTRKRRSTYQVHSVRRQVIVESKKTLFAAF